MASFNAVILWVWDLDLLFQDLALAGIKLCTPESVSSATSALPWANNSSAAFCDLAIFSSSVSFFGAAVSFGAPDSALAWWAGGVFSGEGVGSFLNHSDSPNPVSPIAARKVRPPLILSLIAILFFPYSLCHPLRPEKGGIYLNLLFCCYSRVIIV